MCLPIRAPVQPPSTQLPIHPPAPPTRPVNVAPRAKTSRCHRHRVPFPLPKTRALLQLTKPRADFGPPNVPIRASIHPPNNRRSTSHPLRGTSRLPSPNTISEWKKTSTRPVITRMNPMASSFQPPKPTYAQTVKASLPVRSSSEGKVASTTPIVREAEALALEDGKQPTNNHQSIRFQGEHGSRHGVASESSRETSVSRYHSSTPSIQVMIGGETSHAGPNIFSNPLVHHSDYRQARYVPRVFFKLKSD